MRAVIRRGQSLVCDSIDMPDPGEGQTLVRTLACGICGSDLHAVHMLEHNLEVSVKAGLPPILDPSRDVVLGHQYCAEIVEHGPGTTRKLKPGTRVVSLPSVKGPLGMETIGFSHRFPGGFAEHMILTEGLLLEVPNGLSDASAAMTEPMAVGDHAVAAAQQENAAYLVIGCGPVGLSVVAALKARGLGPVAAVDFSSARRAAAETLGADIVVDPALSSPHAHWSHMGVAATFADMSVQVMEQKGRRAVIFECVGREGLLADIVQNAPPTAQIIVVGVCPGTDRIEPSLAIIKQIDFRFVVGYTADEFASSLRNIAEGRIPVEPLMTSETGLSGVPAAFEALASPDREVQVMVYPQRA